PLDRSQVLVAYPQRALLATVAGAGIPCLGSPLPSNLTFDQLVISSRVASTRVTEGYSAAFEPRSANTDSGTRFLLRLSGFPAGARAFVPNAIAGSDAAQPTIAGDLGGTPSGGRYVPGSNSLLLIRVASADASGASGVPVQAPSQPVTLNSVSEVALSGG